MHQRVTIDGTTFAQVARELNVNETTISVWAKRLNIKRNSIWMNYNKKHGDRIEELYTKEDATYKDLRTRFGCDRETTMKILNFRGVPLRTQSDSATLRRGRLALNEEYFNEWSSEMAYIIGFINADGNIMYNEENSTYVMQVAIHEDDRDVIYRIKNALGYEGDVGFYDYGRPNGNKTSVARLSINSKRLVESLMNAGIEERKSLVKRVPSKLPKDYIFDYLRGYFDGNGNVDIRYQGTVIPSLRVRLASGSEKHLNDVQDMLKCFGFTRKKIEKSKNRETYTLRFNNDEAHYLHREFYRKENSISMKSKKRKFDSCVEQRAEDKRHKSEHFKRKKGKQQGKVEYF